MKMIPDVHSSIGIGDRSTGPSRDLRTSRTYNWYSWEKQVESIRKLTDLTFSWVLPGHGYRHHSGPDGMRRGLATLLGRLGV